jgi:site-specific recombinase XerC
LELPFPLSFHLSLHSFATNALNNGIRIEHVSKLMGHTDICTLGKKLELNDKQIKGVIKRFQKNKPKAIKWIDNSFLSSEYKQKYKTLLEEKYTNLFK